MKSVSGCKKALMLGAAAITVFLTSGAPVFGQVEAAKASDPLKLDQVVVSATKTEHTLGDVPVAAEVITKKEIEQRQVKTVADALKLLTGVEINQSSGSWGDKGKIQMQGLDAKHTLILVDGQRWLGGHGDATDMQSIPIEMVERIEVLKGPSSALYGSEAIGGVVNIITKQAYKEYSLSASSAIGSRATQIHSVTGGIKKGGFGGLLSYTYRESDGVDEETDRYSEHLVSGALGYEFSPALKVNIKPFYSEHKMIYQERTQERIGVNTAIEWVPDSLSKLTLSGSFFDYRHYTGDESSNWSTLAYDGEIMYSRLLFDRLLLTGGYQYAQENIDDQGKDYKADQKLHSFYLQSEINLHPVVFVLGTRVDDHDLWGTEINPKGSVLIKITNDLKLRGSVGTAFKSPSLAKLYADSWRMGPYLVHANPDLKPEKSIGYQLGVEYTFQKRHLAKVSVFRNDVEDMIVSKIVRTPPPPYGMYWENIDEAYTQGVEVSLTSRLTDTLTAQAGYTYLETRDKKLDKELTLRPKHRATLEFNQKIPQVGMNINVTGLYVGERFDSAYEGLDGYDLWNVAVTKDLGNNIQLFARADNVFGKKDVVDEYDLDGARFMFGAKMNF